MIINSLVFEIILFYIMIFGFNIRYEETIGKLVINIKTLHI